jgi:hypothetical protein
MMSRIIVLTGPKRCGKDTWAKYLVDFCGYKKLAFADTLRETVSMLYDIPLSEFQDDDLKEKHHANLPRDDSRREALKQIGTEGLRNYDPDIWVNCAKRKLERYDDENIVITDARFPNEMKMLGELGANIYYLVRHQAEVILYNSIGDGSIHESESYMPEFQESYNNIDNAVSADNKDTFYSYIRYTLGLED